MAQTPEAVAFLERVSSLPKGPGVSLENVLKPSLDDEAELRRLFATDKTNTRLDNPYVGLVDVFNASADIRRARVVKGDEDRNAQFVMPLTDAKRRKEGTPAMVADLDEFKKNWSVFTENSLSQLSDWNNVVAAGGAVLGCLSPLPDSAKVSKRAIRKYFHSVAYPTSDVDLFLWGLTPEQAEVKINAIYEAVRDSVPWDVTCVRTKHTVSIHSQYPYRSVQIVLRLYRSPAEILAGFDIDAPCCAYNGHRVFANPRAIVAMMRQCNTVDMTRRSPSYEVRLAKYSSRHFEVYVPTLRRGDVDPTIYERSIVRIEGLARLLVLEKLNDRDKRNDFLESRRQLRGRPNGLNRAMRRSKIYKGDLKADTTIAGLEMNDYDVASLHIPYGPRWDARRIAKLIYQTDLGMNSTFNPKNKDRRLHRHSAFFGTMEECLEDCCEHCPEPLDEDEKKLQKDEDEQYIRGRVEFIQENPGRQSISGSFNPIDVGEWSEQVYIGETQKFFSAIASHDRSLVSKAIEDGFDVNHRDHVGRTPLHFAILCNAIAIAHDLIDAGARMTARLVDGRTSLHLAAQLGQLDVVRKLLERSAYNAEQAAKKGDKDVEKEKETEDQDKMEVDSDIDRPSSEDDWSSEGSDVAPKKTSPTAQPEAAADSGDIPEDEDVPDVFDVNAPDWDFAFTPLQYAIVCSSLAVVEELLAVGADPKLVTKANSYNAPAFHPLTLSILAESEDHAFGTLERLLLAGATSSTADNDGYTIFYHAICSGRTKLVSHFLRSDPNASMAANFPVFGWSSATFPFAVALRLGNYSMLATLLAHGVKLDVSEDDVSRAMALSKQGNYYRQSNSSLMSMVHMPAETAIAQHDDVIHLLVALGVEVNLGIKTALESIYDKDSHRSLIEWVQTSISQLNKQISEARTVKPERPTTSDGWRALSDTLYHQLGAISRRQDEDEEALQERLRDMMEIKEYLSEVERLLISRNAKTWNDIYPENPTGPSTPMLVGRPVRRQAVSNTPPIMDYASWSGYSKELAPQHLRSSYDELYEACFSGKNNKIQQLCLPEPGSKTHSGSSLLQISVQTSLPSDRWGRYGYSTLYAAVSGRRWNTARLILSIAAAQYVPKEDVRVFETSDITLDADSDNESDVSCDSDGTADPKEALDFADIAKRPSSVCCPIPPKNLLSEMVANWPSQDKKSVMSGNLIKKAIFDKDFEAFVNIADLYKALPEPLQLPADVLDWILENDQPEMLDEYIRRTGLGIDLAVTQDDSDEAERSKSNTPKIYLGLSVHGKKRKDLAKRNDPNAKDEAEPTAIPLLWRALRARAGGIVDYLLADRAISAYRFYIATNSDERAEQLRRVADLTVALPERLGWHISPLGESPLTAAALGKDVDSLKKIFSASPKLMKSALHERIKFLGYNALMLAVDAGCTSDMFDYLLAKGISGVETHQINGWNIFHMVCYRGHFDLLNHLLRKLPQDLVEALLAQPSKGRLNTPLHLAVKTGKIPAVQSLLASKNVNLLLRDIDGSTPLHAAVRKGYAKITKLILDASPTESLHAENSVGETPLEMAVQKELLWRTREKFKGSLVTPNALPNGGSTATDPRRYDILRLEIEVPKLRATINELIQDGRLKKTTKLAKELTSFADMMDTRLATAKAEADRFTKVRKTEEVKSDSEDAAAVLVHIREAVAARPGLRQLVHLIDVQKSVQGDLAKPKANNRRFRYAAAKKDGLEPEEDKESEERKRSLVFTRGETLTEPDKL